MSHTSKIIIIGALALAALAGCASDKSYKHSSPTATTGSAHGHSSQTASAEAACLHRARASSVRNPVVISAEFSQANTLVTIGGSQGDRYRCLSSNDGVISDFSLL